MGLSAVSYQRMMIALLPPGRLWRLVGESLLSSLFLGCADELERLDGRASTLMAEAIPSLADELLPEYEEELELTASGTNAERQARVVARRVARQRYRPSDFQVALAPLLGLLAADVPVLERTHAMASSMGDDREIYRFFVYRDPALPGTLDLEGAQALVDDISPSQTAGYVVESIDFLCDDTYSLCDRDLLGS